MRNNDKGKDNNVYRTHMNIEIKNWISSRIMQDWPPWTLANSELMSQGWGFVFRFDISPTESILCLDSQQLLCSCRQPSVNRVFWFTGLENILKYTQLPIVNKSEYSLIFSFSAWYVILVFDKRSVWFVTWDKSYAGIIFDKFISW